jgi:hypothetical protein
MSTHTRSTALATSHECVNEEPTTWVRLGKLDVGDRSDGYRFECAIADCRDKVRRFLSMELNEIERHVGNDLLNAGFVFVRKNADDLGTSVDDARDVASPRHVDASW